MIKQSTIEIKPRVRRNERKNPKLPKGFVSFDKIATSMGLSRYELAQKCILDKLEDFEGLPPEEKEKSQKKDNSNKVLKSSVDSSDMNASFLTSQNPLGEAEATTQENSQHSAQTTPNTTALTRFLRRSEEKP